MSDFVWYWTKNNKRIYTREITQAEQALKDGLLIMAVRLTPDFL